jgi:hypothetical protein
VGRTYFTTLDEAMRFFGTHSGTERMIKESLRFVDFDAIWVPNSASYVALGREGVGVAWFGKTYVMPTREAFVELPGYAAGGGGGTAQDGRVLPVCPGCHLQLPATGSCDDCG